MNKVLLIGRLTDEPELRYTPNGTAVANFTLAVERDFTNQQGERETDFIDVVVWRKQAENVAQYLGKGRLCAVEGRLQISKNQNNGRTYINPEIVARNVKFLDWPDQNQGQQQGNQAPAQRNQNQQGRQQQPPGSPNQNQGFNNRNNGGQQQQEDIEVPF